MFTKCSNYEDDYQYPVIRASFVCSLNKHQLRKQSDCIKQGGQNKILNKKSHPLYQCNLQKDGGKTVYDCVASVVYT